MTGMIAACLRAAGTMRSRAATSATRSRPPRARRTRCWSSSARRSSCGSRSRSTRASRVLLNLAPDHLDWHGRSRRYADAKAGSTRNQGGGRRPRGQPRRSGRRAPVVRARSVRRRVVPRGTRPDEGEVGIRRRRCSLARVGRARPLGSIGGERAPDDAAAAAAAASGVRRSARRGARRARRLHAAPHRGETWRRCRVFGSSTTRRPRTCTRPSPRSTASSDAVLIAGGRAKGVDLSPLAMWRTHCRPRRDRGGRGRVCVRVFEGSLAGRARAHRSRKPSAWRSKRLAAPAGWCCSLRRAPAGTSSPTTPSGATGSPPPPAPWRR